MAWDSVPWFVGGGAVHSPEVARLLSYAAFGGLEGVVGPTDLKVTQLGTPGAGVQVAPGAAAILNKASGGTYQAYAGRLVTAENVTIAATGGAARSDLIIARVEDPFMAGEPWDDPGDVTVGPYIFTRVVSGVASNATTVPSGTSGIPLARVDVPASTSAITNSMIVDLRGFARQRRRESLMLTANTTSGSNIPSAFAEWPNYLHWGIAIPSWAYRVKMRGILSGVKMLAATNAWGEIRASIGTSLGSPDISTQSTAFDDTVPSGTTYDRRTWSFADSLTLPSALRGANAYVWFEGRYNNFTGSVPSADTFTSGSLDIEFEEHPF